MSTCKKRTTLHSVINIPNYETIQNESIAEIRLNKVKNKLKRGWSLSAVVKHCAEEARSHMTYPSSIPSQVAICQEHVHKPRVLRNGEMEGKGLQHD